MTQILFEQMAHAIGGLRASVPSGYVAALNGGTVQIKGLPKTAQLGDRIEIKLKDRAVAGEIVALKSDHIDALMNGFVEGLALGSCVRLIGETRFAPSENWIGRIIDPDGKPLDGHPLLPGVDEMPLVGNVLPANERRGLGPRMETGFALFNTILPIAQGQRIGLFAGSGVGKSTLLANLSKGIDADVIVIALVGERGRELRDFVEKTLGPEGLARSVVVAATSDRSATLRRRCAWSAMTVAEYFRDKGKQVLFLCDSVTRFCEAHREVAATAGENGSVRGLPASTQNLVASLCERSGPGVGSAGDITAIFTVLVSGSDMEEPVADMLRGILDGHFVLDRQIAERGRFPAVDILRSVSRCLPDAANDKENELIAMARKRLSTYSQSELMIKAGLYEPGGDQDLDASVHCYPQLERFSEMRDGRLSTSHFASLSQCIT